MLTLADVERARDRISGRVRRTPLLESPALSELSRARVFLKIESFQVTGSFKERGAANKLLTLEAAELRAGVITASAGNHAQAVARHAQALGIRATVVMPEATPLVKVTATRRYGAEIVLHGSSYDDAAARAAELAATSGQTYVHPFDDWDVIAGQGTVALEILEELPDFDAVLVPVGGGGLLAGVATVLGARAPAIRIIGVESGMFPGMQRALQSQPPLSLPPAKTIADGIAVRRVGLRPSAVVRELADDVVLVDEEEIAEAVLLLLERERLMTEGAGAVGLAALLHRDLELAGKTVVVVVSGGNIDVNLVSRIIERGLVKSGRLGRLVVRARDVVGTLSGITAAVAEARANIVSIEHDRTFSGVELGETRVELVLEIQGPAHFARVEEALRRAGFSFAPG